MRPEQVLRDGWHERGVKPIAASEQNTTTEHLCLSYRTHLSRELLCNCIREQNMARRLHIRETLEGRILLKRHLDAP